MQQSQNEHWRGRVKPGPSFFSKMLPYAAGAAIGATLTAALLWGTYNAGRTKGYSYALDSQQQATQQENVQQKKEQQGIRQQTYTQSPTTAAKEIYAKMTIDEMKSYPIADDWKPVSGVHIKMPTGETVVISTRSKRETADKSYGTVMYLFDKNGKIDYDQARTVGTVSDNARQWVHYLYEGRPEDFHRKVIEFAGDGTIANLAIYKTLADLENRAVAQAVASVELAKFIQNPVPYLGIKFVQEFAREWEKEKYNGITSDNKGNHWLDIGGGNQRAFATREEALAYKQELKARENAPTPIYTFTERKSYPGGESEKRTTVIGPPKTPAQWETERSVQQDPIARRAEDAYHKAGALKGDVERATGEAVRGLQESLGKIFRPPEGQRRR
ncbi:MAG: hypothetical protein HYU56_00670 [Candidatus Aenigmarchaeota archaeon]|nr:hypothetical protein [Candidatus Aenigmarchaeota archaeon]